MALRWPDKVSRLVFVAGVFHHDGWMPQAIDPTNEPPPFMRQSYAELSPDGPDHFDVVAKKLAAMHLVEPTLSTDQLAGVGVRSLVMVGDDEEVRLDHALALYEALPDAELAIVPGTSHGLLAEKPALCTELIIEFLLNEPTPTLAPIRRAR